MSLRDVYETGFDEDDGQTTNRTACPECDGDLQTVGGETTCTACGAIVDEYRIDHAAAKRSFSGGTPERTRTGHRSRLRDTTAASRRRSGGGSMRTETASRTGSVDNCIGFAGNTVEHAVDQRRNGTWCVPVERLRGAWVRSISLGRDVKRRASSSGGYMGMISSGIAQWSRSLPAACTRRVGAVASASPSSPSLRPRRVRNRRWCTHAGC
jgi:transcription initiation factor TFIIIB Brf1 subunit/transcription initiation factor TFIIB